MAILLGMETHTSLRQLDAFNRRDVEGAVALASPEEKS